MESKKQRLANVLETRSKKGNQTTPLMPNT